MESKSEKIDRNGGMLRTSTFQRKQSRINFSSTRTQLNRIKSESESESESEISKDRYV